MSDKDFILMDEEDKENNGTGRSSGNRGDAGSSFCRKRKRLLQKIRMIKMILITKRSALSVIVRRSVTGKMIDLPNNITVCRIVCREVLMQ